MNKKQTIQYGKKMQDLSQRYLKSNAKLFRPDNVSFEADMSMIFNDARDLYIIGSYMIKGDLDAAMGVASDVDTAVRDEIPASVYNYLVKNTLDQE
jgi:hypothetical protein